LNGSGPARISARGFSLLESLIAIVLLVFVFLAWSSGMIVTSQAQSKAAVHTQTIETANERLEMIRRDALFWSTEFNPAGGPYWAAYNDDLSAGTPHAATGTYGNYTYLWRADLRNQNGANTAVLTVVVFMSLGNRTEKYSVMGLNREQ
jgi:type II secretory pathway pseudopilin PulG